MKKLLVIFIMIVVFACFGNAAFISISGVDKLGSYTIEALQATVDFKPDTLDLESGGKYVTVYIELPSYDVDDIDISRIRLNNVVQAESTPTVIGDYDEDGIKDLMIKFDRTSVQRILSPGVQTIAVTGNILDMPFFGMDTVSVIDKEEK